MHPTAPVLVLHVTCNPAFNALLVSNSNCAQALPACAPCTPTVSAAPPIRHSIVSVYQHAGRARRIRHGELEERVGAAGGRHEPLEHGEGGVGGVVNAVGLRRGVRVDATVGPEGEGDAEDVGVEV